MLGSLYHLLSDPHQFSDEFILSENFHKDRLNDMAINDMAIKGQSKSFTKKYRSKHNAKNRQKKNVNRDSKNFEQNQYFHI